VSDQTPLALELGERAEAAPATSSRRRYTTLAVAIFAAGMLVGGVSGAILVKGRTTGAAGVAARSISSPEAVPAPRPTATASEHAREPRDSVSDAEQPARSHAKAPAGSFTAPVPKSNAPTCEKLLGDRFAQRNDPRGAARQALLAKRALRRGDIDAAQVSACQALAWDHASVDAHVNLARLFLVRRDWEQAVRYGESALELEPASRRALGVVGDALAALNDAAEARKAWLAAERRVDANPAALDLIVRRDLALARRVERKHDFSLAERLYRRVLLLRPDDAAATRGVATCLAKAGHYEAAEVWARRAEGLGQNG
jgi:tetratricopeptide (TPR) repeat protein